MYLDQLRQSIGLRAYGQRDPLNEYKKESFILFEEMLSKIRYMIISILSNFEIERLSEEFFIQYEFLKFVRNQNNDFIYINW